MGGRDFVGCTIIILELKLKAMIYIIKCQMHFCGHYQKYFSKTACLQLFYP